MLSRASKTAKTTENLLRLSILCSVNNRLCDKQIIIIFFFLVNDICDNIIIHT